MLSLHKFNVIVLLFVAATCGRALPVAPLQDNATFKVCGFYCGPNWCSNEVISEQQCVATGVWGIASQPGNCADACCRVHDHCCGAGLDRPACNDAIVQCIQSNDCEFSVCGVLVWAAMKTVSDWCCGSPCPTFFQPTAERPALTVEGQAFCAPSVEVRFQNHKATVRPQNGEECVSAYEFNATTHQVSVGECAFHFGEKRLTYFPHTKTLFTRGTESLTQC